MPPQAQALPLKGRGEGEPLGRESFGEELSRGEGLGEGHQRLELETRERERERTSVSISPTCIYIFLGYIEFHPQARRAQHHIFATSC